MKAKEELFWAVFESCDAHHFLSKLNSSATSSSSLSLHHATNQIGVGASLWSLLCYEIPQLQCLFCMCMLKRPCVSSLHAWCHLLLHFSLVHDASWQNDHAEQQRVTDSQWIVGIVSKASALEINRKWFLFVCPGSASSQTSARQTLHLVKSVETLCLGLTLLSWIDSSVLGVVCFAHLLKCGLCLQTP